MMRWVHSPANWSGLVLAIAVLALKSLGLLGGGVGLAAVEIGKGLGAKVIACASSEEKLAVCREHGADQRRAARCRPHGFDGRLRLRTDVVGAR